MIRRFIFLGICLVIVGLFAVGCEQTRANLQELGDYGRGMILDGSDIHSHAR